MTGEEIIDIFEKYDNEYLKFDNVVNKCCNSPDVNAFIIISKILGSVGRAIVASEHDEIWLDGDADTLAERVPLKSKL